MAEVLIRSKADLDQVFAPKPTAYIGRETCLSELKKAVDALGLSTEGYEVRTVVQESRKLDNGNWSHPHIEILVNDSRVYGASVDFEAEQSSSSWRARPTGRARMVVGSYGNRQSYPPKKNGGYSYDKAAEKLGNIVREYIRGQQENARAQGNEAAVQELKAKHGITQYDDRVSTYYYQHLDKKATKYVAPAGKVYVNIGRQVLTPEQADKLLTFLKTL